MAYNAKLGRDLTPEEESFLARNPNDEDRMSAALTNVTSGRRYDSQDTSKYNTVGDYVGGGMGDGGGYGGARNFGLPSLGPVPVPNLPTPEKPPPFAYDSYQAAQPFTYQDWRAPSVEQVMADPSYQWRKQQGEQSLQGWAAAKGTLNSSDTALALINYGQNAASQEYGNVYGREYDIYRTNRAGALESANLNEANRYRAYATNRAGAVDTYNTNYQTQFVDPYRAEYQRATDLYAPQMAQWMTEADLQKTGYSTDAAARMQTQQLSMTDAWNRFLADLEDKRWQKDFEFRVAGED